VYTLFYMTLKGTTAKHPNCNSTKHPAGTGPKMMRLYKRDNRKFKPCAWICPDCRRVKVD
jgi:hypothetical protein